MRLLLLLLLVPLVQAHPEDATTFSEVPPRVAVGGTLQDGSVRGVALDAEVPAGTLVALSTRNYGPGIAQFSWFDDRNETHVWQVAPGQVHVKTGLATGVPIYFDVRAVLNDATIQLFSDVADCTVPCSKAPAHQVPGVTLFRTDGGRLEASMHRALPITHVEAFSPDGELAGSRAGTAMHAKAGFFAVHHGVLDGAAHKDLLAEGGSLMVETAVSPHESAPLPPIVVLVALAVALAVRRYA